MSSLIEIDHPTLATLVEDYLFKAEEYYHSGLNEAVAEKVKYLEQYKESFWMKLFIKKPAPMVDFEAEARASWQYQYRLYYARRMAFLEKFRQIVERPESVKRIFISADDHQRLIDCDVIYDYSITGNYGNFMKKEDWM